MKQVNVYLLTSQKGPGRRDGNWCFIIESMLRAKDGEKPVTLTYFGQAPGMGANEAELTAAVMAFRRIHKESEIVIFTQSKWFFQALSVWLPEWEQNGWQTKKKEPVKHADKWKELDELMKYHNVRAVCGKQHKYLEYMIREIDRTVHSYE